MAPTITLGPGAVLDIRARFGRLLGVLHSRLLLDRDGLTVADVPCRHRAGPGSTGVGQPATALVLVRRGLLPPQRRRHATPSSTPPSRTPSARARRSATTIRTTSGDDCTPSASTTSCSPRCGAASRSCRPVAAAVGAANRPRAPTAGERRCAEATTSHAAFEHALAVAASVLAGACDAGAPSAGRPATGPRPRRPRRRRARSARRRSGTARCRQLAAAVGASPASPQPHLRAATGTTIARHRMRLRARAALESLATGDHDLARLAADVGFADQRHLCRVIRSETGRLPRHCVRPCW